jgi:ElaB/YqjD/DUF883 family membrane-anchored ribosome-binding protein
MRTGLHRAERGDGTAPEAAAAAGADGRARDVADEVHALAAEIKELLADEVATAADHSAQVQAAVATREAELRAAWQEERAALEASAARAAEAAVAARSEELVAVMQRVRVQSRHPLVRHSH